MLVQYLSNKYNYKRIIIVHNHYFNYPKVSSEQDMLERQTDSSAPWILLISRPSRS